MSCSYSPVGANIWRRTHVMHFKERWLERTESASANLTLIVPSQKGTHMYTLEGVRAGKQENTKSWKFTVRWAIVARFAAACVCGDHAAAASVGRSQIGPHAKTDRKRCGWQKTIEHSQIQSHGDVLAKSAFSLISMTPRGWIGLHF